MHPNDASIIARVRDHFSDHFRGASQGARGAIDVGTGPNLYPALAMLPWCENLTLFDAAPANVKYLISQIPCYDAHWDKFYDLLSWDPAYSHLRDPRSRFRSTVTVSQGEVFDLWHCQGHWSMGTMFFVAESITTKAEQFRKSLACFMHALQPGSPFAAAFMEHSSGFRIGKRHFAAYDVDAEEVLVGLADHADDLVIHHLEKDEHLNHEGYTGMLLACGRRRN
jgi:hypothetical protein